MTQTLSATRAPLLIIRPSKRIHETLTCQHCGRKIEDKKVTEIAGPFEWWECPRHIPKREPRKSHRVTILLVFLWWYVKTTPDSAWFYCRSEGPCEHCKKPTEKEYCRRFSHMARRKNDRLIRKGKLKFIYPAAFQRRMDEQVRRQARRA